MSRIGKQPVPLKPNVTVNVTPGNLVTVKGAERRDESSGRS